MGMCYTCPSTSSNRIIERSGKFHRLAQPGCNLVVPCLCESVSGTVSLRVQDLRLAIDTNTKDNVFIVMHVAVQYEVLHDRVKEAFYKLTNPRGQIEAYVLDVVRAVIPKIDLDHVFLTKEDIARHIKHDLAEMMSDFGYNIAAILVTDIVPSKDVKDAMNQIVRQQRLKIAAVDEGETVKIKAVKQAEAEGQRIRIEAAAEAEATFLHGLGIAREREAIIQGIHEDVSNFSSNIDTVSSKDVLELIVLTQYLDTMRDVAAKSKTAAVFVPGGFTGVQNLSDQIREGLMQATASRL